MDLRNTRTTILNEGQAEQKREEIRDYFHATFSLDDQLYETLTGDEAFFLRPEPLRHPLIFYLGHTATFYINKLIVAQITNQRVNPKFESMFAVGVDEMSWDDLNDAHYDWPSVAEVKAYREQVRRVVDDTITHLPLTMPIHWDSPFWVIMMGIEHQRIHIETSSVIIRRLPIDMVRSQPLWDICPLTGSAPENSLLPVPGARVVLGKDRDHPLYGWDNEYGHQDNDVWDFAASRYLVSNQEFLEFVQQGGYQQRDYWTEEGWSWVQYTQARHPLFWIPSGDTYQFRTLTRIIEMPWNWPVEVNYLEAKAFCNFLAAQSGRPIRLPTEAQWYRLRDLHDVPDQPHWQQAPGNINLEHWASPCPVDQFAFGDFYDVIGNVWQWTETPITGFEGFRIHPFYDDFSTPTFDTKHNLIKGGSWISTGNEATRDSRYAFRRHFFQHAGLRYVESDQPLVVPEAMYESDVAVSQYCAAHYGPDYFSVPNFPLTCAQVALALTSAEQRTSALDLGCAVGRATFELAREFQHVTGIDFSARFIRVALQLKEKGSFHYELVEEGEIVSYHQATLGTLGLQDVVDRVEFFQGDATNLKPRFGGYDLILAANLLDRLADPKRFVQSIHFRLNIGGLLVLTSPYTWLEEFTKKDAWLGGIRVAGEPVRTFDALKELLGPRFELIEPPRDVPFVIRETQRKFQHTVAQLTAWRRVR